MLGKLTKDELTEIRQNLSIKGISSLKKQQLAEVLELEAVTAVTKIFAVFDLNQYNLMKKITKNNGVVKKFDLTTEEIEYYRGRGLIFTGTAKGSKVLAMPQELIEGFNKINTSTFQEIVKRNTQWVRLAQGLLFYYGTLDTFKLADMVKDLTKAQDINVLTFISVIDNAVYYYDEIRFSKDGYAHYRVFDPALVKKEHRMRGDLDFYPFTYEQLYQAGTPGFIDKNADFSRFTKFIIENYEIKYIDAEELVEECVYAIRIDQPFNNMIEFYGSGKKYKNCCEKVGG